MSTTQPRFTRFDEPHDELEPLVSVVIPCLNEEENIERCVRTALEVLEESGIPGEVIVADNASEDRSAELAPGLTLHERTVNGEPGLVAEQDGVIETVFAFDVAGERIRTIWAVRNPEKLRQWTAV